MDDLDRYLSTHEAAMFLGLSHRTLERYRVTGEGPAVSKVRPAGLLRANGP